MVDDNYLGRLEAYTGLVREAELPLDLRRRIGGRRHPRQENRGPPSAQVQATPQQARSSSVWRQGWHQRRKRPAYRRLIKPALTAPRTQLANPRRPAQCSLGWRSHRAAVNRCPAQRRHPARRTSAPLSRPVGYQRAAHPATAHTPEASPVWGRAGGLLCAGTPTRAPGHLGL